MSLHRHRHIYTVGSLGKSKRWHRADPFESDPFKIHSYNFHYADRPCFPMPLIKHRRINNESLKDCQTYFYNKKFSNTNNLNAANNIHDKRLSNLSKFEEYRRKKASNQGGSNRNFHSTGSNNLPCTSKVLSSQSFVNKESGNLNSSSIFCAKSIMRTESPKRIGSSQTLKKEQQLAAPSASGSGLWQNPKRTDNSGCEIKINIKGLDNNSRHENLNIKIETDSMFKNLNIPLPKENTSRVKPSESFVIDKNLSKFSMRRKEKDRIKDLTSIYSSQTFTKSSKSERSPSLMPFTRSGFVESNSSFSLGSKKSMIKRVKDNLSVYDSKSAKKSCSHNNLNRGSHQLAYGEIKASNSFSKRSQPSLQSITSSLKQVDSTSQASLRLCSNAKLPLNININVYADKLKSLKL